MTHTRDTGIMILTFKDKELEKVYIGKYTKRFSREIQNKLLNKLLIMESAENINELRAVPSNHLEKLEGNLKNTYSIRLNSQYRLCFKIIDNKFYDLEVLDYH